MGDFIGCVFGLALLAGYVNNILWLSDVLSNGLVAGKYHVATALFGVPILPVGAIHGLLVMFQLA